LQRADWGQRPLSAEQLDYAAWDPEWCYRVHRRLDPLVRSWDPAADDPAAIQSRYADILRAGMEHAPEVTPSHEVARRPRVELTAPIAPPG
jgi:ribonuclease D